MKMPDSDLEPFLMCVFSENALGIIVPIQRLFTIEKYV